MNSALKSLKEADPKLYETFIKALKEDLDLPKEEALSILECPSCHTRFHMTLTAAPESGKSGRMVKRKRKVTGKLFNLIVQLARLQNTSTGGINREFKTTMAKKFKGMNPVQIREKKIEWLKVRIGKYRAKGNVA